MDRRSATLNAARYGGSHDNYAIWLNCLSAYTVICIVLVCQENCRIYVNCTVIFPICDFDFLLSSVIGISSWLYYCDFCSRNLLLKNSLSGYVGV